VLDFHVREKILGKPVRPTICGEGKVTLPLIYALESAEPGRAQAGRNRLADGNYDQVPFGKILQILNRYHGIERAQDRRPRLYGKGSRNHQLFPPSPYQRALFDVTDLITDRDH